MTLTDTVLRTLPSSMHLLLTTRCNMRCLFCWERRVKTWDMPESVAPQIAEFFPALRDLVWQGGEAFLHPSFRGLMGEAVRHPGLSQTLLTNGAFIDESWLELFLKAPSFNVVLPVESVRPADYARLRPGGSFPRLEKNLRLLQEARSGGRGLKYMLNIIIMRSNADQLEEICAWGCAQRFERIFLTPLYATVPEFYSAEFVKADDAELGPALAAALPRIRERARDSGTDLEDRFFAAPPAAAQGTPSRSCRAPWRQLYIGNDGDVSCHCACNRIIGRLGERPLRELWNGPEMTALRRSLLAGDYAACNPLCPREA
jgi:MoaA/NifB/PqqE/SkfB family radical SAM enzyme